MLHVTVHIGELEARSLHNQLLSLDIAYDKVEALASYLVAMLARQGREMAGHLRDYRGLQKNATRAFTALALANIYLCRGHLQGQVRP